MRFFKPPMIILSLFALLLFAWPLYSAGAEEGHHASAFRKELEDFGKVAEAMPPSEKRDEQLGIYYYNLGKLNLREKRLEEALAAFEKGENYITYKAGVAYHRGLIYFLQKRYYEAEAELFSVAHEGEGEGEALKLLGRIYYKRGELRSAVEAWERVLEIKNDDHEVEELLAKAKKEMTVEERLDQVYTGKFVLQYDGERDEEVGETVLDILGEAYNDVGVDLDYYPKEDITVILYTKKEFKAVTGAPDWSGGLYDGKIRVPLGGINPDSESLKSLIYHEYTHAAIRSLTGGRCPRWLNEGIAVFEESRFVPFSPHSQEEVKLPVFSSSSSLNGLFASKEDSEVHFAYERSYALVKKLADNFGIYRVAEWLHLLAKKRPAGEAFTSIFGIYDLTLEGLLKEE